MPPFALSVRRSADKPRLAAFPMGRLSIDDGEIVADVGGNSMVILDGGDGWL